MLEIWNKKDASLHNEGQPVGQGMALCPDMYRLKLLSKVPSMKAINTYNSIATDNFHSYDNLSFSPETESIDYKLPSNGNSYDNKSIVSDDSLAPNSFYMQSFENNKGIIYTNDYDYPTLRSTATTIDNQSINESRKDEGSTSKLISSRKIPESCWSWLACAETVLCTISLAAGLGNLYRLPQTTLIRGGLPFLVAYIILSIFIGLPLLFLELGLGQLAQEGFTKTWRAVPLFRGVGHIKFIAICLISMYYPLYMALFGMFIIWLGRGPPPLVECASVKITEAGYKALGIPGQDCLNKTFLESPFTDPKWYGMLVGLLFLIWFIIMLLLIGRTKTYVKSLAILLLPCLGFLIALTVKTSEVEGQFQGLQKLIDDADWSLMSSANIWYYAVIQVFFSTNVGFGSFITNAGIIFSKVNAFWTTLSYVILNIMFGVISVIFCYILSGDVDPTEKSGNVAEYHLVALIYDSGRQHSNYQAQVWTIIAYSMLIFAGFISMLTFIYTLLKAIKVETKSKWSWWKTTVILCLSGFVLSSGILLSPNFTLVHLLDHYVVGNLILISVVLEVLAFIIFYGSKRIQLDFEFILGKGLSKIWIVCWWLLPIILVALLIWVLSTESLIGIWIVDPLWVYITGWGIVIVAIIYIMAVACFQIQKQDKYYTFNDKIVAVTKPLRKWGPVDPIMRYSWVQWHSKAKNGERDFTLKRRGTRDYTHSVKKRKEPLDKTYVSTISVSSTLSRRSPEEYTKNDLNQNQIETAKTSPNYNEPLRIHINSPFPGARSYTSTDSSTQYDKPLRVTSLVDALDPSNDYNNLYSPKRSSYPSLDQTNLSNSYSTQRSTYPSLNYGNNINIIYFPDGPNEGSASEGYGTYRKGPYSLPGDKGEHVCHRKKNAHEMSTEL